MAPLCVNACAVLLLCVLSMCQATLIRQFMPDASAKKAFCLDGTDAGYYLYRNTTSSKWIIHMQGGGFCSSAADCAKRATSRQGSSRDWACALPDATTSGEQDAPAPVSSDSRRNPNFRYWNRVFLPYCSGDLWIGQNYNASGNLSFSGHFIITAVIDDLLTNKGMNMATDVILGGSSAGGIGVMLHLDDAALSIKSATNAARRAEAFVGGYVDGWTRFYPTLAETKIPAQATPSTSPFIANLVSLATLLYQAYLPASCTNIYSRTVAPFYGTQCADPRWGARTISNAALLVLAARWDTYNIFLAFGNNAYACATNNMTLDAEESTFIQAFGDYSYNIAQNITMLPVTTAANGVSFFLTNCYTHSFLSVEDQCSSVNGTSAYSTLVSFVSGGRAKRRVLALSPTPTPATSLRCNADCGSRQCGWGTNTPYPAPRNCTMQGVGFEAHRFGMLCGNNTRRNLAVSNTFNKESIKYVVVNATARNAVCMDDTPYAYYVARNPATTNWIIFLRGGGFCDSFADCIKRSTTDLGTSKNYACTLPAREVGKSGVEALPQPINADPAVNPKYHNWNRVYMRYCSGDTFLGRRTKAQGNLFGVSTAGHYSVVAAIEDMLDYHGLDQSTAVVFSGSSAGCIGAITQLDLVNTMINARTGNTTKVIGAGDGGWFRGFPLESEFNRIGNPLLINDTYGSAFIHGIAMLFGNVFNAYHHPGCQFARNALNPALGGHDCLDAQNTFPFLKAPAILLTARWDTYDLYLKLGGSQYTCASGSDYLNPNQRTYVGAYGRESMLATDKFRSRTSAIFMPTCYKHTSFGIGKNAVDGPVTYGPPCGELDGLRPYDAMRAFVDGAINNEANLDSYTRIAEAPADSLGISCRAGCGAKQCAWSTNINGMPNCSAYRGSSFSAYGAAEGTYACTSPSLTATTGPTMSTTMSGGSGASRQMAPAALGILLAACLCFLLSI